MERTNPNAQCKEVATSTDYYFTYDGKDYLLQEINHAPFGYDCTYEIECLKIC